MGGGLSHTSWGAWIGQKANGRNMWQTAILSAYLHGVNPSALCLPAGPHGVNSSALPHPPHHLNALLPLQHRPEQGLSPRLPVPGIAMAPETLTGVLVPRGGGLRQGQLVGPGVST